ncbi:FliG C-terminal domain-containing protein [Yoonia sp. BS5-3]|uniref:Flagellar motor switch protein FliG n=1 Tax=Yoonia phaeophyticola TaxID=3137369 RepID=A0ABZ2V4S0_9RHOB
MNMQMSMSPSPELTRRRKAAMIVQMLISDGGELSLSQLPESLQELLTREMGAIKLVDRETVSAVAEEFLSAVDAVGLTAPGNEDAAILAIADHLSPQLADRLRKQTASVRNGDHWPLITSLPNERIVAIMTSESIEVCAITLSKLSVAQAAEVLSLTPGDRARKISLAMSQTADTSPEAVRIIGKGLAEDYGQTPALAFERAPVQRLGAILNSTKSDRREEVLESLDNDDPAFATDVRNAIFTFKDIVHRIKELDIPNCIRAVPGETLTIAIAAALKGDDHLKASAEFILSNVSQRMATQIRDDAMEAGTIKKAAGEEAMGSVTNAIRELVDTGTITMRTLDEEDEDT